MRRAGPLLALAAMLACAGCPTPNTQSDGGAPAPVPTSPKPPPPQSTAVELACANLSGLKCPEGTNPACYATLARVAQLDAGFLDARGIACLLDATTQDAVRKCGGGFVRCGK